MALTAKKAKKRRNRFVRLARIRARLLIKSIKKQLKEQEKKLHLHS